VSQLLLYNIIGFIEGALTLLIIARIAVSWIGLSPWHPVVRWLRVIAQILQTLVLGGGVDPAFTAVSLVEQLVVDIAIAIAIVVFIRILLAVFHADPWHPMVQMVRTVTDPLVAPFAGLHRGRVTAGFDYPAIAALVVYIILIIAIRIVFGLLLGSI
jgi:uncharacterized protein YggT (Ycf19 family)